MPEFRPVELKDREWLHNLMCISKTKNADFTFVHLYSWGPFYNVKICDQYPVPVISSLLDGNIVYALPYFDRETMDRLLADFPDLRLQSLSPEDVSRLEEEYPGKFAFAPQTENFDYVYSAEKLATLSGKKLHAKRNFINRFLKQYEGRWKFEPIINNEVSGKNIEACCYLDNLWSADKAAEGEKDVIDSVLKQYSQLGLDGGVLFIDDSPVAFTIGERVCCDTFVVHFEKALSHVDGAYPMINKEFVNYIISKYPEIKYINREEDMGLESLKKAKQSYYPEFLVEKYLAVLVNQ
jgi:hypothetical protein